MTFSSHVIEIGETVTTSVIVMTGIETVTATVTVI
jgi:hypothetical protein